MDPFALNPFHIALLVFALLLIFGPSRASELGRSLGKGLRDFKQSVSGDAEAERADSPQPEEREEGSR